MLNIKEYVKPATLEKAYELGKLGNTLYVSGGLMIASLKSSKLERLVDLKSLGMEEVEEEGGRIKVGANVKLSAFMTNHLLLSLNHGFLKKMMKEVGSTQIRNMATVGGSVAFRLGWSDIITALLVSEATIEFYNGQLNEMPLKRYLKGKKGKEIVTAVYIPKNDRFMAFEKFSKSTFDIATLNVGVGMSVRNGRMESVTVAVGSRPMISERMVDVEEFMNGKELSNSIDAAAQLMQDTIKVGGDIRAKAEYRRVLSAALLKKAMRRIRNESQI